MAKGCSRGMVVFVVVARSISSGGYNTGLGASKVPDGAWSFKSSSRWRKPPQRAAEGAAASSPTGEQKLWHSHDGWFAASGPGGVRGGTLDTY